MANPYARYHFSSRPQHDPAADAAERDAGFMRLVGALAPAAGTAVGGLAGAGLGLLGGPAAPISVPVAAGLGASLGGAAGTALGAGANYAAENTLDPIRKRELRRQALLDMLRGAP